MRARPQDGPLDSSNTANRPQGSETTGGTTNGSERPLSRCPEREGWVFFDYETGVAVPARCGRNTCAFCVVGNARRRAIAIAYAKPEREITLTHVGEDWDTIRRRVNKVVELLRRKDLTMLIDFHVEDDPNGKGQHHAHIWQKGSRIPKHLLTDVAVQAGCGQITHISRIRDSTAASQYGLKGLAAARYGLKGTATDPAVYLLNNGGRLSHHSRGFYTSPEGATIGVRLAETLGIRALHGQDEQEQHQWTLVRETSLASVERVREMATARASGTRGVVIGPSSTVGPLPSTP